ncbi:MAG: hypothetical protein WCT77_08030 [Bacteroidota bacterium]
MNSGNISQKEAILLREQIWISNSLQEKTLGNFENFDKKTFEEIIIELRKELSKESVEKLKNEREKHQTTKSELEEISNKLKESETKNTNIIDNIRSNSQKSAKRYSNIFSIIFACIVIAIALLNNFNFVEDKNCNFIIKIIITLIFILGFVCGINLPKVKLMIKEYIYHKNIKKFKLD